MLPVPLELTYLAALAVLVLALDAGLARRRERRERERRLAALRLGWGKPVPGERDLNACRAFFEVAPESESATSVDEQTWRDLDLDDLFAYLDRTCTVPGRLFLYRMLRSPLASESRRVARHRVIELFVEDGALRDSVQAELDGLGRRDGADDLAFLLWGAAPEEPRGRGLYAAMGAAGLVSLLSPLALGALGVPLIVVAFAANFVLHHRFRYREEASVAAFRYLGHLLACGRALAELAPDRLGAYASALTVDVRRASGMRRQIASITSGTLAEAFYEYVNVFFLVEVRSRLSLARRVSEAVPELRRLLTAVGELDALLALASLRDGLPYYATPELVSDSVLLEVDDAFHPLLPDPVAATLHLGRGGCIVTGPNMAGKSTLLRVLGLNALLAQTICTCMARRYRGSAFRVISSISPVDDVIEGRSRYLTEAERLLEMIEAVKDGPPVLCLIDEVLRGTTSVERVAAGTEILSYLARASAIVVAATHDLDIPRRLQDRFVLYRLGVRVEGDELFFDHRPHVGLSTQRSAIPLLRALGFPGEIVTAATRAAENLD